MSVSQSKEAQGSAENKMVTEGKPSNINAVEKSTLAAKTLGNAVKCVMLPIKILVWVLAAILRSLLCIVGFIVIAAAPGALLGLLAVASAGAAISVSTILIFASCSLFIGLCIAACKLPN